MAELGFMFLVVAGFLLAALALLLIAITFWIAGARSTRPPCPHCGIPNRRLKELCRTCGRPLKG